MTYLEGTWFTIKFVVLGTLVVAFATCAFAVATRFIIIPVFQVVFPK
jgi:hypothetical protein